jgi:hypothetical protein
LFFAGTWPWCPGRCRGAATLPQQEKNKSANVQRKKIKFYPCAGLNDPGARHHGCCQL